MKDENKIYQQNIENLRGTLAVEGITLTEASQKNIERIYNGSASVQNVIRELHQKYARSKA